eukprot:jgi/Hompol1/5474/HPOL_001964-RA
MLNVNDPATQQLFELLAQLLAQLSSQDNQVRAAAEDQLNHHWLANQPQILLAGLAFLLATNPAPEIRTFAAVLLRRMALRCPPGADEDLSYYSTCGDDVRSFIQMQMLQALASELDMSVCNKICDTVCELADHMLGKGAPWTELIQGAVHFASSQDVRLRTVTFKIMGGVPGLFINENPRNLLAIFTNGIQDTEENVRLAALKACSAYLIELEDSPRQVMAGLVTLMLNTLPPIVLDASKDEMANESLSYLIDLAEAHPKLFKSVLPQVVQFMTLAMNNTEIENSTRQSCLELLLTLAEFDHAMMRRHQPFAQTVIPILINWMCEHDDDPEWFQTEDLDDIDQESNETVGEQSMDRIARYMGGKVVLPIAFNIIPSYLSSPEWQKRHAALRCISAIGEGCHKIMNAELERVIGIVLPHLADPHPRVRHAACNAIGQMCTDFAPKIQDKFHEAILTHLIPVMDDIQHLRVQTYAAAALVNFAENAKKECISPYLNIIIPKLLVLLQTGKTYAQEQAITSLATVADSASVEFKVFYPQIMPILMNIIRNAQTKELRPLRGKTLECATLIAMAVGKEIFMPDVAEFTSVMHQIQAGCTEPDDPLNSYLLGCWARVCKVLGADFAPYMSIVLPPLYASAMLKPDVAVFNDVDDPNEEEGYEMIDLHGQRIGIKTSILDEKCTAIEMLLCYAKELGPLFHQYVKDTMTMVLPLLGFYFHDGVRFAAAAVIPLLFDSWVKAQYPKEQIFELWQDVATKLIKNLNSEGDSAIAGQIYTTFYESLAIVGAGSLTDALITDLMKETAVQLKGYAERANARQASRKDPDYDSEDEEVIEGEEFTDDTLIDSIAYTIRELYRAYGSQFVPYFAHIIDIVEGFLISPDPISRRFALSVYQDMIQFATLESVQYQPRFLQRMIAGIVDKDPNVRQTAAYGIGVAAKLGEASYMNICISSLENLVQVVQSPSARTEENTLATENAISAIGKICRAAGQMNASLDLNAILPIWFEALPIIEDQEEFEDTYTFLLDLVEMDHPAVSCTNNTPRLAKLVDIFTQVLAIPGFKGQEDALVQRILRVLQHLLLQCTEKTRSSIWASLPEDRRKMLTTKGFF